MATPKDIIEKKYKELLNKLTTKDFKGLASYWAPDGKLMPPGNDIVVGAEQIAKYSEKAHTDSYAEVHSNIEEVVGEGEYVISRATYIAKPKDGTVSETGKIVTVWKKINHDYVLYIDVWNDDKKK